MDFTLTTLGVSSASPMSDRYPSAHVLNVHGRLFLIDCGEGAQILLARHGISHFKISDICISHLHGDHIFGLFGLLTTMSLKGRTAPLTIYAPSGFSSVLTFIRDIQGSDLLFDVRHIPTDCRDAFRLIDSADFELFSFPLSHGFPCYGFLFREKEPPGNIDKAAPKSFAYCCDTAPFSRETEFIKGVDLLLHEATFGTGMEEVAMLRGHSTSSQAARAALAAGARKLVITHFSSRYRHPEVLLEQVKEIFENAFLAREGETFEI